MLVTRISAYQYLYEEVITRRKKRQLEIRHWFMRYKSTLSCIDCGISHPAVLQFHHRNRAEKSFNISDVVRRATSIKQITNEMRKCDVLCVIVTQNDIGEKHMKRIVGKR